MVKGLQKKEEKKLATKGWKNRFLLELHRFHEWKTLLFHWEQKTYKKKSNGKAMGKKEFFVRKKGIKKYISREVQWTSMANSEISDPILYI